jgi:hypothetical protein
VALVVAPAGAAHGGEAGGGHVLEGQESRSSLLPACKVGLEVHVRHTPRLQFNHSSNHVAFVFYQFGRKRVGNYHYWLINGSTKKNG